MALPEKIKTHAIEAFDEFCEQVPDRIKHQIKRSYSLRGNDVTLFQERYIERHNQWIKMPIAKFKYDEKSDRWSLWWTDSHDKWIDYYQEIKGEKNNGILGTLIDEVEKDTMGIFWG